MYRRRWGLLTHLQSSQVAPSVAGGLLTFVPIVTSFVASTTLRPYFVWKSTLLNNRGCTKAKSFHIALTFCVVYLPVLFKLWPYPLITFGGPFCNQCVHQRGTYRYCWLMAEILLLQTCWYSMAAYQLWNLDAKNLEKWGFTLVVILVQLLQKSDWCWHIEGLFCP